MEVRELIFEQVVADLHAGLLGTARHAWRDDVDAPTVELPPMQGGGD